MFIRKKTYDDIMQRLATLERQRKDLENDGEARRRRIQDLERRVEEFDGVLDYWVNELKDEIRYIYKDVRDLKQRKNKPGFFRKAAGFVSNLHWHSPGIGPRR